MCAAFVPRRLSFVTSILTAHVVIGIAFAQAPPVGEGSAKKTFCKLCNQWFDGPTHDCPILKGLVPRTIGGLRAAPNLTNRQAGDVYNRGTVKWNAGLEAWQRGSFTSAFASLEGGLSDFRQANMLEPSNAELKSIIAECADELTNGRKMAKRLEEVREALEKGDDSSFFDIMDALLDDTANRAGADANKIQASRAMIRDMRESSQQGKKKLERKAIPPQEGASIDKVVNEVLAKKPEAALEDTAQRELVARFSEPRSALVGSAAEPSRPSTSAEQLFDKPSANTLVDTRVKGPLMIATGQMEPWPPEIPFRAAMLRPRENASLPDRRSLLAPIDKEKLFKLDQDAAVRLLVTREDAARAEAGWQAVQEFKAELKAMRSKGLIREGESLQAKERADPEFARALKAAMARVTDRENKRIGAACSDSLSLMEQYIRRHNSPAVEAAIEMDQAATAYARELDIRLRTLRAKAFESVTRKMEAIVRDGLLDNIRHIDDLQAREKSDPVLAARMEPINRERDQFLRDERRLREETLQTMSKACENILRRYRP